MSPTPLSLVVCAAPFAERTADLAKTLTDADWDVTVVATPAARAWLDDAAIHAVTGRSPIYNYRTPGEPSHGHRPTMVVSCPLSFNTLNKLAAGNSDTYALGLLNEAVASRVPLIAVPMISDRLWPHPALAGSLERLTLAGVVFLDPKTGRRGARPVASGSGPHVASVLDTTWLLPHLTRPSTS